MTIFLPSFIKYFIPIDLPFFSSSEYIFIKYLTFGHFSIILFTESAFFSEYIITSALDLCTTFSSSLSGSSLSVGIAIESMQSEVTYDTYQAYVVSLNIKILGLLFSFSILFNAVPNPTTSSPNCLYVISSNFPFGSNFSSINSLFAYLFIEYSNTCFISE